jgi:Cu/Ag efflux protein CusF
MVLLVCGSLVAAVLSGCPGGGEDSAKASRGPAEYIYQTRGLITEFGTDVLKIHHEAIDDFVYPDRSRVGMNAMVMDFPLGPGVSSAGLTTGDKVDVTFAVWTRPSLEWHVTSIERLPRETELTFSAARPMDFYVVRGRIDSLPDPAKPTSEFIAYHEPIDNFRDASGTIVGMNSMKMPFPIGKHVSLEGFAVNDFVEIEFVVRYTDEGLGRWWIVRLQHLPSDTELRSGAAQPPTPSDT